MRKSCLYASWFIFDRIIIKVGGNQYRITSSAEFDFWRYLPLSDENFTHLNWSQLANFDQILCVASLGWGKGCIRFYRRLDQNAGFHGNRKAPLIYNGENDVSTFSRLFLIRSCIVLAGNEDMHNISGEFKFRPDRTTDYGVSCPLGLNNFP